MAKLTFLACAVLAAVSSPPAEGKEPPRYRGVVTAIAGDRMTVQSHDGSPVLLKITSDTKYAYVIPARLDEVEAGTFVGAAVKGAPSRMTAVEVALIPENMRAGRIPYYPWDPLPDPTVEARSTARPKTGRNASSRTREGVISTQMTNGLVAQAHAAAGGRDLTVNSANGVWRFRMRIPSRAPIVRYVLADRGALVIGSQVMVKTNPGGVVDLITIGRGVTPPM
jgi:hypothetical protein